VVRFDGSGNGLCALIVVVLAGEGVLILFPSTQGSDDADDVTVQ
tara:strand:+ start:465 stop:596 length:132 start_codon:yes stop_codon:yes gene_type:complete